jgi:hypothetical protein
VTVHRVSVDSPAWTEPLPVDTAFARAASAALVESDVGTVGLEAEAHLVALDSVSDALPRSRVEPLVAAVRATAGRSAVTIEPGGQVELSGRPAPDIATAVGGLGSVHGRTTLICGGLSALPRRRAFDAAVRHWIVDTGPSEVRPSAWMSRPARLVICSRKSSRVSATGSRTR